MITFLPDWLLPVVLVVVLGIPLALVVVVAPLMSSIEDYGFSPRAWARGWLFAYRRRLHWWQRPPALYEFRTTLYCGQPRSGKTLMATRDAIRLMRQGVRVVANYDIIDPLTGVQSVRLESWYDMLVYAGHACISKTPTVFVIDEIHNWANARFYTRTPVWWLSFMQQRGHYGVGIIGTCQSLGQVEVALRRLIDYVVFVRPTVPFKLPIANVSVPLFSLKELPAVLLDQEGRVDEATLKNTKGTFAIAKWWVYGGYSTAELIAVAEWSDDEETTAAIDRIGDVVRRYNRCPDLHWVGGVSQAGDVQSEEVLAELVAAAESSPVASSEDSGSESSEDVAEPLAS